MYSDPNIAVQKVGNLEIDTLYIYIYGFNIIYNLLGFHVSIFSGMALNMQHLPLANLRHSDLTNTSYSSDWLCHQSPSTEDSEYLNYIQYYSTYIYIRRPRPSPRPGRRLGPPQVWTLSSSKPSKPLPLSSFPNRHPRAGATAMRLFMNFQSCRLLARKGSKLSKTKFQTPSPTGTPGPRPLPQLAPHGQGQGHFPNRHPRARPQQWLS